MKKELRKQVWNKYGKRCAYCGKLLAYKDMQVDHYLSKAAGRKTFIEWLEAGTLNHIAFPAIEYWPEYLNSFENLKPSCRACNYYKSTLSPNRFKERLSNLTRKLLKIFIVRLAASYGIVKIEPFDGAFYFEKYIEEREQ